MGVKDIKSFSPLTHTHSVSSPLIQNGKRRDGRRPLEFRPPFLKIGTVTQAIGSAYVEFGSTKVIVAVYGPREKRNTEFSETGKLNCDLKYASFATSARKKYGQDSEDLEHSSLLLKALECSLNFESFPKSTVDVFALILESGGSDLAAAIICSSLALSNAGIELFDLVIGISLVEIGKELILDPSDEEERYCDGKILISFLPISQQITQLTMEGEWAEKKACEAIEIAMNACSQIDDVMRSCLREQN